MAAINDLPDEVLEFILGYLPPYRDLEHCVLVCRRWEKLVKNVLWHTRINLNKGITEFRLHWKSMVPVENPPSLSGRSSQQPETAPTISGRFSHSAVIHENSMYVFGGRSSASTTYNDLWRFDLSKRQWIRPLSMGTYPSPKACASMVCYKENLILFGGWRHPSPFPPYQPWRLFDELHAYNINENKWVVYTPAVGPPCMAGHSASIRHNQMIVFGGYQKSEVSDGSSNDVWCLDLNDFTWQKQETTKPKPPPRYGQFQITLDDENILIIGGCGGPNNMFSDAWLLNMKSKIWRWRQITIKNKKWSATHMWCNPACKVDNKLVVLGPTPAMPTDFQIVKQALPPPATSRFIVPSNRQLEAPQVPPPHNRADDFYVEEANRRLQFERNRVLENEAIIRGGRQNNNQEPEAEPAVQDNDNDALSRLQRNLQLRRREYDHNLPRRFNEQMQGGIIKNYLAAFNVQEHQNGGTARERQLERLRRLEEKMNYIRRPCEQKAPEDIPPSPKRAKKNCLAIFVCDLTQAMSKEEPCIEWIEYKNYGIVSGAPERLILSSIVAGNGELIMFGGLPKESLSNSMIPVQVSNSLHFLSVPRNVI